MKKIFFLVGFFFISSVSRSQTSLNRLPSEYYAYEYDDNGNVVSRKSESIYVKDDEELRLDTTLISIEYRRNT
ncbi:hypothetical protein [Xylanibacter muris]|uniref:RHS repeat protein n=1 Tax=Xylanibacter muris TaxID=2736290 RepID=A0ABX2AP69_9BACT|nr:hypothetical protein [Xylanibacter muris]NPD93051.1 hypothetical protein [Xylanibacter muris]